MITKWTNSSGKPERYKGNGTFEVGKGAVRINNMIIAVVRSGDIVEVCENKVLINQTIVWEQNGNS